MINGTKTGKSFYVLGAHFRQIIRGVVCKSGGRQRIYNWESAEFRGIVPKLGSEGHGKSGYLLDPLRQKAPRRYFTFTLPLVKEVKIMQSFFSKISLRVLPFKLRWANIVGFVTQNVFFVQNEYSKVQSWRLPSKLFKIALKKIIDIGMLSLPASISKTIKLYVILKSDPVPVLLMPHTHTHFGCLLYTSPSPRD